MSGSLEAIEAKKTLAGKDFGELVRERRRQFGLPLPIAEKVLPFRPSSSAAREQGSVPEREPVTGETGAVPAVCQLATEAATRVSEAWNDWPLPSSLAVHGGNSMDLRRRIGPR